MTCASATNPGPVGAYAVPPARQTDPAGEILRRAYGSSTGEVPVALASLLARLR